VYCILQQDYNATNWANLLGFLALGLQLHPLVPHGYAYYYIYDSVQAILAKQVLFIALSDVCLFVCVCVSLSVCAAT